MHYGGLGIVHGLLHIAGVMCAREVQIVVVGWGCLRAIIDRAMSYDEPVRRRGGHRDFLTECGALKHRK